MDYKAERKAKQAAAKLARQQKAVAKKSESAAATLASGGKETDSEKEAADAASEALKQQVAALTGTKKVADIHSNRTCTGEVAMKEGAKDIKFINFTLSFYGENLIENTDLELNYGNRYGLIGRNGSGKSTFLESIAYGDLNLPEHIDTYLLNKEAEPSEDNAMDCVVNWARKEVARLNELEETIMTTEGPQSPLLQDIYDRLDELDESTFESRAGELLFGLGFRRAMMGKATKDMSGGWRMRVALAQALFIKPTLLLMDEPTNHLDLEACVWLEQHLAEYPKILLIVSHSQDFLDGVCTNMMQLTQKRTLQTYKGNYSTYVRTKRDFEIQHMKQYEKQQVEIKDIKQFIASCGTYSNMVKQAGARQKQLDKMVERGLFEKIEPEHVPRLHFPTCAKLPPPVLAFNDVSFAYDGNPDACLLHNMNLGIDMESRIVLVGPNGAGKSTLLKLVCGETTATKGEIKRHGKLQVARYHQHSEEILDNSMTPIDWIMKEYPVPKKDPTEWRRILGRSGVSGKRQTRKIETLSDGQKTQLVFCWLSQQNPHMLLFDEPTNHLDMESIDGLAQAINDFEGGMVLVSHDFRLLAQTARQIWVVDQGKVTEWEGDITSYKKNLLKEVANYKAMNASQN